MTFDQHNTLFSAFPSAFVEHNPKEWVERLSTLGGYPLFGVSLSTLWCRYLCKIKAFV